MGDDGSGSNAVQLKQSTWNSFLRTFNEGYLHTHTHTRYAVRGLSVKAKYFFLSVCTNVITEKVACWLMCKGHPEIISKN
jgi:hypothetical protein